MAASNTPCLERKERKRGHSQKNGVGGLELRLKESGPAVRGDRADDSGAGARGFEESADGAVFGVGA